MEEKRKEEPGGGATFKRLIKYLFHYYKPHLIVVCICIVISACASVVATTFLQQLIDECIHTGNYFRSCKCMVKADLAAYGDGSHLSVRCGSSTYVYPSDGNCHTGNLKADEK